MLSKPDKTQYERERVCETLHSMGLLLEDHSCRGGGIAELDNFDVHLLAVGAYMTGLRQVDANATVIAWICSHAEVRSDKIVRFCLVGTVRLLAQLLLLHGVSLLRCRCIHASGQIWL